MQPLQSTSPPLTSSSSPPSCTPPPHTTLLHPDFQGALHVEAALRILHQGDTRVPQADEYLAGIRTSPAAWPIVCALVRSHQTTPAALLFSANTILSRLRADWLAFPDDHQRLTAFTLAVDGVARPDVCRPSTLSSLHAFGKACGFALSAASAPSMREAMWSVLLSRLTNDRVRKCHVFAAIGVELNLVSRRSDVLNSVTSSFCTQRADAVLQDALEILNASSSGVASDDQAVSAIRAAIACVNAWHSFADKSITTRALLHAIVIPQLSDDVAETLSEVVGYSSTDPQLLLDTCQALTHIHNSLTTNARFHVVHHAISEVACALSDGNADELMESDTPQSKLVVHGATELLWLCLKSQDESSFFAAVDGWNNWISADSLVSPARRVLRLEQLSAIVELVITRLAASDAVLALAPNPGDDVGHEHASELAKAYELFLSTCASIGVGAYVGSIAPLLERNPHQPNRLTCMVLFALCVTGDAPETEFNGHGVGATILPVMMRVLDLIDGNGLIQNGVKFEHERHEQRDTIIAIIQRKALDCLAANAYAVARQFGDDPFRRVIRVVVHSMHDVDICERAGKLLLEIGSWGAHRALPFLRDMLASFSNSLDKMPLHGAEVCVRAVARAAGFLESHEERAHAMSAILGKSCDWLQTIRGEGRIAMEEEGVHRHLTLISTGLHEMNDNKVRWRVFTELRDAVADVARIYSSNGAVGKAVCRVLETCVLPTLMDEDDGDDECPPRKTEHTNNEKGEERRVELAMWCGSLALECMQRSRRSGEACWLQAIHAITPHVLGGLDDGMDQRLQKRVMEWVTQAVQAVVEIVGQVCEGKYERLAEMSMCVFRVGKIVTAHETACIAMTSTGVASGFGTAGVQAMKCGNGNVVRECLSFWKAVFGRGTREQVWRGMISAAGGPEKVTAGALQTAQVGRLGCLAADVVLAMCALVTSADGLDPAGAMKEWLTNAFENEDVPRIGLDRRVKHMLLCGCISAIGSKRDFRRALDDVGRVSATGIR